MHARLRAPLTREDALLVAVDPADARAGGKVGEGPDLLADDRVDPVEDAVVHRQEVDLELLAPGLAELRTYPTKAEPQAVFAAVRSGTDEVPRVGSG
jgi:hypothetical protein